MLLKFRIVCWQTVLPPGRDVGRPAEDSEPSSCRNGTNTLLLAGSFTNPFSYRAAGNRTSCRRNPVGRGVIPNVIVIFVTMKQAVTPLRLGSDRISSLLVRYAIPSIIAMTSSSLYNIVDSIFIGHGVGPIAISGVALSMPLMNIASAFGSLIGIGAAALTSIRLGQGRREAAEGVLGNVVLLNFLVAALFTAVGLLLLDPILCFFGASDATIGYARDFMQIILGGTIVTHMYLSLNEVIPCFGLSEESHGDYADGRRVELSAQSAVHFRVRLGYSRFGGRDGAGPGRGALGFAHPLLFPGKFHPVRTGDFPLAGVGRGQDLFYRYGFVSAAPLCFGGSDRREQIAPGVRRRRGDRGVWHHLSGGDALPDDRFWTESRHAAHRGVQLRRPGGTTGC